MQRLVRAKDMSVPRAFFFCHSGKTAQLICCLRFFVLLHHSSKWSTLFMLYKEGSGRWVMIHLYYYEILKHPRDINDKPGVQVTATWDAEQRYCHTISATQNQRGSLAQWTNNASTIWAYTDNLSSACSSMHLYVLVKVLGRDQRQWHNHPAQPGQCMDGSLPEKNMYTIPDSKEERWNILDTKSFLGHLY